jgi:hypothetical protein
MIQDKCDEKGEITGRKKDSTAFGRENCFLPVKEKVILFNSSPALPAFARR